jgi:hypothetical protein
MNTVRRAIVWTAVLVLVAHVVLAQIPDAGGHWGGAVTADLGEIHFALDLGKRQDASSIATRNEPAQGLVGLPLTAVVIDGRSVRLVLDAAAADLSGTLAQDPIVGPLTFRRVAR